MPETAAVLVRPARPDDAPAIAEVQVAAWRGDAALPEAVLASLDRGDLVQRWQESTRSSPTPRHHVLVATESHRVVGLAVVAPSDDPDAKSSDAELVELQVHPEHRRAGHGSRLLAASVDTARSGGFGTAQVWVTSTDDRARAFLVDAGFGPDGATRELDLEGDGAFVVRQVRLHADVTEVGA